jgi:hypothetical protein
MGFPPCLLSILGLRPRIETVKTCVISRRATCTSRTIVAIKTWLLLTMILRKVFRPQKWIRARGEPGIIAAPTSRRFEAPEFIRNWTPEERHAAEKRLKAKIDLRLMPMIILMYIMNYLDRVSPRGVVAEKVADTFRIILPLPNSQALSQICTSKVLNSMYVT